MMHQQLRDMHQVFLLLMRFWSEIWLSSNRLVMNSNDLILLHLDYVIAIACFILLGLFGRAPSVTNRNLTKHLMSVMREEKIKYVCVLLSVK